MTFILGVAVGVTLHYLFVHFVVGTFRRSFDRNDSALRKNILDKMGYDSLIKFRDSAEEEINRRRGA